MKKIYAILLVLLVILVSLLNCTLAGAELGLIGRWKGSIDLGEGVKSEYEYTFYSNDTGDVSGETKADGVLVGSGSTTFKIVKGYSYDKIITIDYKSSDFKDRSYSYTLAGNTLTLQKFYEDKNLKLEKKADSSTGASK